MKDDERELGKGIWYQLREGNVSAYKRLTIEDINRLFRDLLTAKRRKINYLNRRTNGDSRY